MPSIAYTALALFTILLVDIATPVQAAVLRTRQAAPTCSAPTRDSCAFYTSCLEAKFRCGAEGYPIGYGANYCQKFSTERAKLSTKGQNWMLDTMLCLQKTLVPDVIGNGVTTCDALENKAFASHPRCYVDSGLCTLPPSDWLAIVDIVEFQTLFESFDALKATAGAGLRCVKFFAFLIAEGIFN